MIAAGFVSNNDPADSWFRRNMEYAFCSNCQLTDECKHGKDMPMISAISRYALRWHNELKVFPRYPIDGTWEEQPNWFMELMSMVSSIMAKVEKDKHEREAKRAKK